MAFDAQYYLANNPDVAQAIAKGAFGGNALNHYNEYGIKEGRVGSAVDAAAKATQDSAAAVQRQVTNDNTSRQALLDKQTAEQQGLFGQYTTTLQGQETGQAMYDRLNKDLGINDLGASAQAIKGQIYGVKDLLDRLDEDVNSRTAGSMTSDAMARRIKASEGGKLNDTLGRLTTGLAPVADMLSSAQGILGTRMQLESADQAKELDPLKMQINALSDRFAREITGFESSHQDTLNMLMDKLQRDRTLTDQEWQQAQDLAASERDFQHQKELAAMSLSAKSGGGDGGISIGRGGNGGQAQTSQVGSRQTALQSRMSSILDNYQTRFNAGYIDRSAIPTLQREFPEYASQIPTLVYSYTGAKSSPTPQPAPSPSPR